MTKDNDLLKKLRLKRERCHDLSGVYYTEDADCQAAAARIEALKAELASGSFYKESDIDKMQESIKALTEQLEDARLDAKEAEAYSVWLEGKLATCEKYRDAYAECDRIGTQAVRDLEAKLAKAVKALRAVDALDPEGMIDGVSQYALRGLVLRMGDIARAALAELKGHKP